LSQQQFAKPFNDLNELLPLIDNARTSSSAELVVLGCATVEITDTIDATNMAISTAFVRVPLPALILAPKGVWVCADGRDREGTQ